MPIPTVPIQFRAYGSDTEPDNAVGVLLPFNGDATLLDITVGYSTQKIRDTKPFALSYSTEEQSISNLVNLLLTRKGERPMQPTFGSLIPEYLFEPNTQSNRNDLKVSIEQDIQFWLPYISLVSVNVLSQTDMSIAQFDKEHNVVIEIKFKVTDVGANRTVTIFSEKGIVNYTVQ